MQAKLGVGAKTADASQLLTFEARHRKNGIKLGKIDQSRCSVLEGLPPSAPRRDPRPGRYS